MTTERIDHLKQFYSLLGSLSAKIGGPRLLAKCTGRVGWPSRGVYFFIEKGEVRSDSGDGPRIVRVGTHALHSGSKTKLWTRLSQRVQAGFLRSAVGKRVIFVAHPELAPLSGETIYAKPDDDMSGSSWRELLRNYNDAPGNNPLGLLPAYKLYANEVYRRLVNRFGSTDVYILSAGWGLIRSSFLTPQYDITFSVAADRYKRRLKNDRYGDFQMIPAQSREMIVFLGGKDYIPLFCNLTRNLPCDKVIFYNSIQSPRLPGFSFLRFETTTRTNWHYECADKLVTGSLSL